MEFIGRVTHVLPAVNVGAKNTKKKSIAVEEEDAAFPNTMLVDFFAQHCDKLEGISVGDLVKLDIRHKLHNKDDKMYNNITGRSIEVLPE